MPSLCVTINTHHLQTKFMNKRLMIQKYPLIKNRSTKKQHLAVYEKSIKAKTNSILVSLWNKQHKHKQLPYPKPKENGSFELTHNPKNYHVLSSTDSQFNHSSKTERTP